MVELSLILTYFYMHSFYQPRECILEMASWGRGTVGGHGMEKKVIPIEGQISDLRLLGTFTHKMI